MYEMNEKSGILLKSDALLKPATLSVSSGFGLRGEFRAILRNSDESIVSDSGWNSNLIVDNAGWLLDQWYAWYTWMAIGSSATAPATNNTSIGALLPLGIISGGTNPLPYTDYPRPPVAPNYERYSVKKYRFVAGKGTGTVNEFTLGSNNLGTDIFCRHVLPAPIPKAADQSLDVYYRIYWYPDLIPRTGTVMIKGVSYDWETSFFNLVGYNYSCFAHYDHNSTFASNFRVYDGAKASPTGGTPTGNTANTGIKSYVNDGAWYRTNRFTAGLDNCNTASNTIKVITVPTYTYHNMQIQILDSATGLNGFPKDNTEEMTVDWKITWGRYVP